MRDESLKNAREAARLVRQEVARKAQEEETRARAEEAAAKALGLTPPTFDSLDPTHDPTC